MEGSGLWMQAEHRQERVRAQGAGGRAGRVYCSFQSPQATCSNIRYQMIISSWSVGPCSLGGLHLLSGSQAGEENGCPVLSMWGRVSAGPTAPSWGDTGLAGGKLGAGEYKCPSSC